MDLLSRLGLKPTPQVSREAPAAPAPSARNGRDADDDEDAGARADLLKLEPELERKEKAVRERLRRIGEAQAKVDKLLAAAQGEQKATLEKNKRLLAHYATEAEKTLDQLRKDLDAAKDPSTRRAEVAAILARAKAKTNLPEVTEIEAAPGMRGGKFNERKTSTVTTAYEDGTAKTTREESTLRVGAGKVTQTRGKQTETRTADGAVRGSEETKTTVGVGGYSKETRRSVEVETGGKTIKSEKSSSTEIGPGGAKRSSGVSITRTDGSSVSRTKDEAIERGDGKLGVAKGSTTTTTDTAGTETRRGASGKAGIVADGEIYGGTTDGKGSVARKTKGGLATGAVGGLHANVSCSVGEPKGDPPIYTVTLKVNLGAEITLSAGHDKKDAPAKGGFAFTGGSDVYMTVERRLDADQAREYVQALSEAASGSRAAPTYKELAIVHAGVKEGWHIAQAMWKGGGKPLSPHMLAMLRAGESVELKSSDKAGVKVDARAKVVDVEAGVEKTSTRTTRVTRTDDDKLDVAVDNSESTKGLVKAGITYSGVGGSVGRSRTVQTSFGYDITVDPKKDPQGRAIAALAACKTAQDYERFIVAHRHCIAVKSRKTGKALSDSEMVGLKLGGAEATIGLHSGVAEEKKVAGDGKLIESKVVGTAGAGGGVKVGGVAVGDSVEEKAVARRDGDGNASLDLSRTTSATRVDKMVDWARSKLPFGQEEETDPAKKKGALAAAAGAKKEVDTQSHDVFGLRLSNKDLLAIAQRAGNEGQWMRAVRRHQELDDWRTAGRRIRAAGGDAGVVAEELARFIGGDKIHRLEMVKGFLRPGGNVSIGKAYGFPDSLLKLQKEYDALVASPSDEQVREVAQKEGAQKAAEFGQKLFDRVEAMRMAITNAKDFRDKAAQAEMLSDLARRKTAITNVLRELAGKTSDADRKAAAEEAFGRLMRECYKYSTQEQELFAAIRKLVGSRGTIYVRDYKEADGYLTQLLDLRAIWKRDLQEAIEIAKANGIPERRYQQYQPNDDEFVRLKKACMQPNR